MRIRLLFLALLSVSLSAPKRKPALGLGSTGKRRREEKERSADDAARAAREDQLAERLALEASVERKLEESRRKARADDAKHASERRMRELMFGQRTKPVLATSWKIPSKPIVRGGFYRHKVNTYKSPTVS